MGLLIITLITVETFTKSQVDSRQRHPPPFVVMLFLTKTVNVCAVSLMYCIPSLLLDLRVYNDTHAVYSVHFIVNVKKANEVVDKGRMRPCLMNSHQKKNGACIALFFFFKFRLFCYILGQTIDVILQEL